MNDKPTQTEQALEWLIRRHSPGFSDWQELTQWLEERHGNAELFGHLSLVESEVADRLVGIVPGQQVGGWSEEPPAPPAPPAPRVRWGRRNVSAAVALAAAVAFVIFRPDHLASPRYEIVATAPGTRQTILVDSNTRVILNGRTRFAMKRGDRRSARLYYGEANFQIAHEPSRRFELAVGDARIVDVGTRFNVRADANKLEVSVAEGEVEVRENGTVARLGAGQMLTSDPEEMVTASVDPSTVGSWTEGRLVYRGDPLALVAADLQRSLGVPVAVDPAIAATPVTAVIQLSPHPGEMPPQLERLLRVKLIRQGKGWLLKSAK